jgi:hypothetical protein
MRVPPSASGPVYRARAATFKGVRRSLLVTALVLATAGLAAADHYPRVPRGVERKDRAVLEGVRRLTYAPSSSIMVGAGSCDCLEPTCDDGHFMLSCGGEVLPFYGGLLNAVRRTSRETCLVCGCAPVEPIELRATPVCAGF